MRADDYDYPLPPELIAQHGAEPRDAARLLVDDPDGPRHLAVRDLPSLLGPGDVVVVNDTRVLPVRLRFRRPSGGSGELLLLEDWAGGCWEALARPSAKLHPGTAVAVGDELEVTFGEDLGDGLRLVHLSHEGSLTEVLERVGEPPLPPYLDLDQSRDPARYQTVYAQRPGSAAAPTAGLHLTAGVLEGIATAGAAVHRIDLAVGLGTFRPIASNRVEDHVMHAERYEVPETTWAACAGATRVVAIGTTVVRALESAASTGKLSGRSDLFIRRGFEFRVVDALMTNFHLPRSSLLVMIDAFAGPRWRDLYDVAIRERYRMLSFGDAMFLRRAR